MAFSNLIRIVFILIAMSAYASQAWAIRQATTVLFPSNEIGNEKLKIAANDANKPTSIAKLSFNLSKLPAGISIKQVTLRLVSEPTKASANEQIVKIFLDTGEGQSLGYWFADPASKIREFPVTSDALLNVAQTYYQQKSPLNLQLRSTSRLSDWQYYSRRSFDHNPSNKPRLIIEYEREIPAIQSTEKTPWRYYYGAPEQKGQGVALKMEKLFDGAEVLSNPVFAGLSTSVFAKPAGRPIHLYSLSLNGRERWSTAIKQAPGGHAVVNQYEVLESIGEGGIVLYDLKQQGKELGTVKVAGLKGAPPPTIGADDSLYFAKTGHVYGLNPQFNELWRYPLKKPTSATFSRLSLSSEYQRRAYFLSRIDVVNTLVALDSMVGQPEFAIDVDDKFTEFHVPIVMPATNTETQETMEYVCISAYLGQDGLLACYVDGELSWKKSGRVSQPVSSFDEERLYVVQNECLWALERFNGKEVLKHCEDGLADTSNLVLDGDENIYFWNKGTFKVFDRNLKPLISTKLEALPQNLELLFAPDATLYAVDSKTKGLALIRPLFDSLTLNETTLANDTVYSAKTLQVANGTTVSKGMNIMMKASERISFGKGVSIEKGASLSCKSGL
jgi:hypothetical protein